MPKQQTVPPQLLDMVDNLYLLGRQTRAMESSPRHYGGEVLLYPNEAYTLKMIAQNPGINHTELCEQMFRTKGATSAVVRKLKQKGMIEQRDDEKDSRFSRLYVTEEGEQVYRNHLEYDRKYIEGLLKRLDVSTEELEVMNNVLRMINQDVIRRYRERGAGDFLEKED